jgi:hypothetical protein
VGARRRDSGLYREIGKGADGSNAARRLEAASRKLEGWAQARRKRVKRTAVERSVSPFPSARRQTAPARNSEQPQAAIESEEPARLGGQEGTRQPRGITGVRSGETAASGL